MFKNIHLQLSDEDIKKIDEWKVSKGMKSRTEAIRSMIRSATEIKGPLKNSMSENSDGTSSYMKPSKYSDENSIEDMVKQMVKKEIKKLKEK